MAKYFRSEVTLEIPKNVDFKFTDNVVTVKGPKGTVKKDFNHAKNVEIAYDKNVLTFGSYFPRKSTVAKLGTLKSIVQNAINGVTQGFTYKMKIAYSHFPITVEVPKSGLEIYIKNFLGERAPRITYKANEDIKIVADKEDVVVSGIDKEAVGQTCANIQKRCRIRQKDKRVFQDGVYVYEKLIGEEVVWNIK